MGHAWVTEDVMNAIGTIWAEVGMTINVLDFWYNLTNIKVKTIHTVRYLM